MQHLTIHILQLILAAAVVVSWLIAYVSASRSYAQVLCFRRAISFALKMYIIAFIFLIILFFSCLHLNFDIISLRAAEISVLILATALLLLLVIRVLHLNYLVARIMDSRSLSGKLGFNIYQGLAIASISVVILRIYP